MLDQRNILFYTVGAAERFAKGDISGGILELISGLATTIPGKGTAISYAIDAALRSTRPLPPCLRVRNSIPDP